MKLQVLLAPYLNYTFPHWKYAWMLPANQEEPTRIPTGSHCTWTPFSSHYATTFVGLWSLLLANQRPAEGRSLCKLEGKVRLLWRLVLWDFRIFELVCPDWLVTAMQLFRRWTCDCDWSVSIGSSGGRCLVEQGLQKCDLLLRSVAQDVSYQSV